MPGDSAITVVVRTIRPARCREKTTSRKGREIDLWYSGKKKDFGGNV